MASRLLDIGVDLDEVLYDFVGTLKTWLMFQHGLTSSQMPDPVVWDFAMMQWGMSRKQFRKHCSDAVDAHYMFAVGKPLPGSAEALKRLIRVGRVHLVTSRFFGSNGNSRVNTLDWLADHHLPYDSLTFAEDKTTGPLCNVYVDDKPENYDALQAAGMTPYLRTQPWNLKHPGRRVADITEFADIVEKIASA